MNMEIELRKYEKYSRDIKWLLIVSGIWPTTRPVIKYSVAFFACFVSFTSASAILNFCIHNITNVMLVTKACGIVISFYTSVIKVCVFLLHNDDFVYLNRVLSRKFLIDSNNKEYNHLTLARFPVFSNFFYTLSYVMLLTYVMSIVLYLFSLKHGNYTMIYPAIFPFAYEPGDLIYWIYQLLELATGFFLWSVTAGVDSMFGLYALQMCGELKVLAHKFQNLNTSVTYEKDLKDCIARHHMLMKSMDRLEKAFGFMTIWLAVTSAVVQCVFVFQASQAIKNLGLSIIFLGGYIMLKLLQAFTYSWYGHLIIEESEFCLRAMYNANWAGSGNMRFMTDVLIVISQRPLTFKAKGCMPLKMDIFTKL